MIHQPLENNRLTFPRLNNRVLAAVKLTVDSKATKYNGIYDENDLLRLTQTETNWTIHLPKDLAFPSVVALDLVRPLVLTMHTNRVSPAKNGEIVLSAHDGKVSGEKLQFEPLPHKNTIGYWVDENARAEWSFETAAAGQFDVHILQGCGAGQGGSHVRVEVTSEASRDKPSLEFRVEDTGHFQNFRWRNLGKIALKDAGPYRLRLVVVEKAKNAVMDVRQIRLIPTSSQDQTVVRDIRDVEPDCTVPPLIDGAPQPGRRSVQRLEGYPDSIYHTLYLPTNWNDKSQHPIIVELTGNGGYKSPQGDVCTGMAQDASLGYGLASNDRAIWICVPYLNNEGTKVAKTWWGNAPEYSVDATIAYLQKTIEQTCEKFNGDRERIVLAGFSRGSIACNYIGLHNDEIAKYWCGFVCFSHYDGVLQAWPYPNKDRDSATGRLMRLDGRPQLILGEASSTKINMLSRTRDFLSSTAPNGNFMFLSTGFRNHTDQWTLRPSPARAATRRWLEERFKKSN